MNRTLGECRVSLSFVHGVVCCLEPMALMIGASRTVTSLDEIARHTDAAAMFRLPTCPLVHDWTPTQRLMVCGCSVAVVTIDDADAVVACPSQSAATMGCAAACFVSGLRCGCDGMLSSMNALEPSRTHTHSLLPIRCLSQSDAPPLPHRSLHPTAIDWISNRAMQLAHRSAGALGGVCSRRTMTVAPASMIAASTSLLHSLAAPRAAVAASAAPSLLCRVRPLAAVTTVSPHSIRFFASITLT